MYVGFFFSPITAINHIKILMQKLLRFQKLFTSFKRDWLIELSRSILNMQIYLLWNWMQSFHILNGHNAILLTELHKQTKQTKQNTYNPFRKTY